VALLLGAVLTVMAMLLFAAWWGQERITYQPPRGVQPVPPGAVRVEYSADDGQPLFALIVAPADGRASGSPPLLLAFHGNADVAAWLVPWATEVARRTQTVVMIPEYRGYGGVPGHAAAEGIRRDARAAAAFARARFGPDARMTLYGHSLGSAIAAELAGEVSVHALVLESPLTSARAIAAKFGTPLLRWLWPIIGRIPYDTEARVQALDVPVWVAHGEHDRVIPVRMGRAVFAAARRRGELLIVPAGDHNDLPDTGGDEYWHWLERALR
jgi:pimeloyl-ACP methyl ester carboxylesterase